VIYLTRGNLLHADVDAIVNTVNTVGVMGRGVALQVSRAFPEVNKPYLRACESGQLRPGTVFTVDRGGFDRPRYVINFPTKRHWKGRSKLTDIESGLAALRTEIARLGIQSVAVPPLGCGLGGLSWEVVRPLIEAALGDLPGVEVMLYEPAGAPTAADMPDRTRRPKMTPGRAVLVALIRQYLLPLMEDAVTLLEVQKLMYFQWVAGQTELKLACEKGRYGPYSANLTQAMKRMEGHFIRGLGDGGDAPDKVIELLPGAVEEAEAALANDSTSRTRMRRVADLIEGFETAYGMELLASVHWVAVQEDDAARADPNVAARLVAEWNERKRKLFKPDHIRAAWVRLRQHDWLTA
jgi:O-acetyl-ADP-ribose deacetylase (regulator of RNase III)